MRIGTEYNQKRWADNKDVWGPQHREWYRKNRTHAIEYSKQYINTHKEETKTRSRNWYLKNRDKIHLKLLDPKVIESRKRAYVARRKKIKEIKLGVLRHYSNNTLACGMCGFSADLRALCIDHINDDGAKQRNEIGGGASATFIYLKKHNYPNGYQVLCANCNQIKEMKRRERLHIEK